MKFIIGAFLFFGALNAIDLVLYGRRKENECVNDCSGSLVAPFKSLINALVFAYNSDYEQITINIMEDYSTLGLADFESCFNGSFPAYLQLKSRSLSLIILSNSSNGLIQIETFPICVELPRKMEIIDLIFFEKNLEKTQADCFFLGKNVDEPTSTLVFQNFQFISLQEKSLKNSFILLSEGARFNITLNDVVFSGIYFESSLIKSLDNTKQQIQMQFINIILRNHINFRLVYFDFSSGVTATYKSITIESSYSRLI